MASCSQASGVTGLRSFVCKRTSVGRAIPHWQRSSFLEEIYILMRSDKSRMVIFYCCGNNSSQYTLKCLQPRLLSGDGALFINTTHGKVRPQIFDLTPCLTSTFI